MPPTWTGVTADKATAMAQVASSVRPPSSVTVSLAVKLPADAYLWLTTSPCAFEPSPKSQA